jgi:hypothetical protein
MNHGRQPVTIPPLDLSLPEARPIKVVFFTDEATGAWLEGFGRDSSLICHRIAKAAREAATGQAPVGEDKRTGEDRRRTA